jgi:hypothetical protein
MIDPENKIPLDDSENSDSEDQQSQQDIHSNGFDDTNEGPTEDDGSADAANLQQADRASEPAYTLNLDADKAPAKKKD